MHIVSINIPEEAYAVAIERAKQEGFKTPEMFIESFVVNDLTEEPENYDHLFTPEVIAHLDDVVARLDAGEKTLTREELDARLAEHKAEWVKKHAG